MDSLVIQLQRECLDSNASVTDVLRKALVVARKLDVPDFLKWVNKETEGYANSDEPPEYRVVHGQIKAWNPFHGWIDVVIGDPEEQVALSRRAISQPIGELESIIKTTKSPFVHVPFPPHIEQELMNRGALPLKPLLQVSLGTAHGILDRVRKIVLDWSLDLEAKGILGEGMVFSEKEKQTASQANYHVHYHGDVGTSQIQQGTHASSQTISTQFDAAPLRDIVFELRAHMAELRLTTEQGKQLAAELASIEAQLSAPQPRRTVIAECLSSVRNILEGCVGSLLASGILYKLEAVWPR